MKIVLVSSFVPFIKGGARFIVEWLEQTLREYGHDVERFYLPFVDRPDDLFDQILAYRLLDLSDSCDRLIAFRPPAHVLPHPNKVLWFIHHIRALYDLWDTEHRFVPDDPNGLALREAVIGLDTRTIREARHIYTNSKVVAARLKQFNGINATPLYPPILAPERFRNDGYGSEIVVVCRIESHKRQWMLIEAMRHVKSHVKLRICGTSTSRHYIGDFHKKISKYRLDGKVVFEDRWISEQEKIERLARALAVAYVPFDEDSYGYPSLEAAHARKAILTTTDSGGVLELVQDGINGLVVPPDPIALAEAMDRLYTDRRLTAQLGAANEQRLAELQIDWPTVINAVTS